MSCASTTCDLFETREERQNLESLLGQRILNTHDTVCASVTALLENNALGAIPEGHFVHSVLGQGSYGTVLGLCDSGTDAKLALKIMSDSTDSRREVEMQRAFHAIGLAPTVQNVSEKRGKMFVLMSRVDATLREYFMKNARWTCEAEVELIFGEIEELIRKLFDQRLAHGDMHLGNLAVELDDVGAGTFCGLTLIDFGLSKRIEDDSVVTLELQLFLEYLALLRTVDSRLGPLEGVVRRATMRRLDAPGLAEIRAIFQAGSDLANNHKTQDDTLHVVLGLAFPDESFDL